MPRPDANVRHVKLTVDRAFECPLDGEVMERAFDAIVETTSLKVMEVWCGEQDEALWTGLARVVRDTGVERLVLNTQTELAEDPPSVREYYAALAQSTTVREADLWVEDAYLGDIERVLRENVSLRKLHIVSHEQIFSVKCARSLVRALKANRYLEEIDINYNACCACMETPFPLCIAAAVGSPELRRIEWDVDYDFVDEMMDVWRYQRDWDDEEDEDEEKEQIEGADKSPHDLLLAILAKFPKLEALMPWNTDTGSRAPDIWSLDATTHRALLDAIAAHPSLRELGMAIEFTIESDADLAVWIATLFARPMTCCLADTSTVPSPDHQRAILDAVQANPEFTCTIDTYGAKHATQLDFLRQITAIEHPPLLK